MGGPAEAAHWQLGPTRRREFERAQAGPRPGTRAAAANGLQVEHACAAAAAVASSPGPACVANLLSMFINMQIDIYIESLEYTS